MITTTDSGSPANSSEHVKWRSVALFYVLACALSWPFYWWRDMHPASWNASAFFSIPAPSPLSFIIKNAVVMWGPGIAALVTIAIYKGSQASAASARLIRAAHRTTQLTTPAQVLELWRNPSTQRGDPRTQNGSAIASMLRS